MPRKLLGEISRKPHATREECWWRNKQTKKNVWNKADNQPESKESKAVGKEISGQSRGMYTVYP